MTSQGTILTAGSATTTYRASLITRIKAGASVSGTFQPILIDLTLMFGAGNEPATAAEFETLYPDYHYYNAGELVNNAASGIEMLDNGGNSLGSLSTPITEIVPADKPTLRLNQLVQNGDFSQGTTGWSGQSGTISSSDGELAITPTVNNGGASQTTGTLDTTHKYYVSFTVRASAASSMMVYNGGNYLGISVSMPNTEKMRVSSIQSGRGGNYIWFRGASTSCTYYLSDVTLIDLTEMYGAGNEPTSTAEVEELIGSGYIPYTTGEDIPNRIFPDGMKSAGSVADEWSGTTATKRIGVVDLGTLSWSISGGVFYTTGLSALMKKKYDTLLCAKYTTNDANVITSSMPDKSVGTNSGAAGVLWIKDTSYTTVAEFKAAMSGVYLYYELATPIEYTTDQPLSDTLVEFDKGGAMRRLPVDTSEEVIAPMVCDFQYGANMSDVAKAFLPLSGGTLMGALNSQNILPSATATYDLGSYSKRFKDLYLSGDMVSSGGIYIDGYLSVDQNANINGDLAVGTNITVDGSIHADGDIESDASVIGYEVEATDKLIIPTAAPSNPVSTKVYLYCDTTGDYYQS